MKKTLATLGAAAVIATAAIAAPTQAEARNGGAIAAGVIGGLALGAIAAGAYNGGYYGYGPGPGYYGPAPDPAEATKVNVPLMIHLPGLDQRVAGTVHPFVETLKGAGKDVTLYEYPGANHAFNNDTSAERYNEAAATLAWGRTMAFFKSKLA